MDTNQLSRCFVKQDDLVTREIAGETIVVPIRGRTEDLASIFTLNELGTLIWNLLDGQASVNQIAEAVSETYEVSLEQATEDILEFLKSLQAEGLIRS
jgi:hypothetical protein